MKTTMPSKILSVFLLLGLLLPSLAPARAQSDQEGLSQLVPLESVIDIPQVTIGTAVYPDISRIDWNQKVTINGKSMALNSDEALDGIAIPHAIRQLVKEYQDEKSAINWNLLVMPWNKSEKKGLMEDGLKFSIARKLVDMGQLPADYFDLDAQGMVELGANVFDANSGTTLNPASLTAVEPAAEILDVKVVEEHKPSFIDTMQEAVTDVVNQIVSWVVPESTHADVATVTEDAIDYLIAEQNADGSWGTATSTMFITTVAAVDALQANGVTGTTTDDGVDWLAGYVADNNDYRAQLLAVLARDGRWATTTTELAETLAFDVDESTGGYAVGREYKPDSITTAKVIQSLFLADFDDPGPEENKAESLGIHYLINTQLLDDGWSIRNSGASSLTATTEAIEALLLWKHRSMGATEVDDTLNPALSSLISTQDSDGTWGNDLLKTALAYHAIKAAGETPTHQLETAEYFEDEQEGDGSFDNDIYTTAKVAQALSIATNSGQLVITDIIPTSTVQTGTTTTFNIRMTNPGNVAVDTGKLHIITDDYHFASFDFVANSIVVNASSTVDLSVGISSTRNFLGNVKFKVFVEGTSGVIHPGSRYEETLTYATAADNRPALPMYFVAYKSVSSAGAAAITWRWPIKSDPKLKNVVLLWRMVGSPTWSAANVTSTTTAISATVGGLTNNATYEASIGTSDVSNNIYNFSGASIANVKVSNVVGNYTDGTATGTVKALDGIVADVQITGVNASTTTQTDEDGIFQQVDVPWGFGYARVNDFRYEAYTKRYTTADTNIGGVAVYTNLKPDTAIPTVTGVSIIGEGDYVMENSETELIQYTVADDIGTGGGIVKGASFYYYDPGDTSWHLIGTESGFLTGTRTYSWNIPGNLVGTGFKIKVIARDFAGKDSAATEWGHVFELMAGNASPSFTFAAPVSGVPADAGADYTIKWTDSDPDNNATTTLSYDPDTNPNNANHTTITSLMEDDPTNEYIWDTSGIATSTKYIRADLIDGHNGTTTIYSTGPVDISH